MTAYTFVKILSLLDAWYLVGNKYTVDRTSQCNLYSGFRKLLF